MCLCPGAGGLRRQRALGPGPRAGDAHLAQPGSGVNFVLVPCAIDCIPMDYTL